MTSKSSSWVSLVENNKRRIWMWGLSIFLFVIFIPICLMVGFSSINAESIAMIYDSMYVEERINAIVRGLYNNYIGFSGVAIFFTGIIAAVAGFEGFSYLHNSVKVDFYESMPEKKGNRFSTIWLNGILIFLLPYLVGLVIDCSLFLGYGYGRVLVFEDILFNVCIYLLFFLGIYMLAIIATLVTGRMVVGICVFVVFSISEFIIRVLFLAFASTFFRLFKVIEDVLVPKISPIGLFIEINANKGNTNCVPYILGLIAFDFIMLVIAYIVFMIREREMAGKSFAFENVSLVVKFVVSFIAAVSLMCMAIMVLQQDSGVEKISPLPVIFVGVIASFVICGVIQMIIEQDISGMIHAIPHVAIIIVASFVFVGIFWTDVFKINEYVPKESNLAYTALVTYGYNNQTVFVENRDAVSIDDYAFENMKLLDSENVCKLADICVDYYKNHKDDTEYNFDEAYIYYTLKSGRKVARRLWVPRDSEEADECIDELMNTSAFKNSFYDFLSTDFETLIEDNTIGKTDAAKLKIGFGVKSLKKKQLIELIDCLKADYEERSYVECKKLYPLGTLNYNIQSDDGYYGTDKSILIYSNYTNTMDYLEKLGAFDEINIDSNFVKKVVFTYTDYDALDDEINRLDSDGVAYDYDEISKKYEATYTYNGGHGSDFIELIKPSDMEYYNWGDGLDLDYDYGVKMYLDNGNFGYDMVYDEDDYCIYSYFVENEIPTWVKNELEKKLQSQQN